MAERYSPFNNPLYIIQRICNITSSSVKPSGFLHRYNAIVGNVGMWGNVGEPILTAIVRCLKKKERRVLEKVKKWMRKEKKSWLEICLKVLFLSQ